MSKRYQVQDYFFKKAKQDGFRARSAYKLEFIIKKYPKIISKKMNILDLGSCPGSFLQVLIKYNPNNLVGVDLNNIEKIDGVIFFQGDINSKEIQNKLDTFNKFHLITSDVAPKTTGNKDVDQYNSILLNETVLEICEKNLKKNGNLVTKIFTGEDFDEFLKKIKTYFSQVKVIKPESCRDRSKEVFLLCLNFKRS